MDELCRYAGHPFRFVFRYLRRRPISHGIILAAVLGAVGCSVTTQYGLKYLVDALSGTAGRGVWFAFALLVALIAGDTLLWRVAGWIASFTFVRVTATAPRLFRHLTDIRRAILRPFAGVLTSRVTAPRTPSTPSRTCSSGTCCRRWSRPWWRSPL